MAPYTANKVVYWDSCVWIDHADNHAPEERKRGCTEVMRKADAGELYVFTSQFSIVEACSLSSGDSGDPRKTPTVFQLDYVSLIPVNREIIMYARTLMLSGYSGLKPYDAIHLSSAIIRNVDEFHTFDKGLLKLNGKINVGDGTYLKICWPSDK